MKKYQKILSRFGRQRIMVIGDIMLDRHIVGSVTRISPEAPVPVVLEEKSSYTPGGAANVAHNLVALGAQVTQVGRIGNDFEGQLLKRELKRKKIDVSGVFLDKTVHTVTKTRVMAKHQQIVRIDKEKSGPGGDRAVNNKLLAFIQKNLADHDAVILSDYGKGMITPELVSFVRDLALKNKKILTVDPKVEHFGYYREVTCITPNQKETENAIRDIKIREQSGKLLEIYVDRLDTPQLVERAGDQLMNYLNLESLLITLGEQGMMLFQKGRKPFKIRTKAREVFDVTGAGDAVISVFTLALATGAAKKEAADIANIAAGLVVGRMGAVAVTRDELQAELQGAP